MAQELAGRRVAALVTDGFEQVELIEPRRALEEAGARVDVVSPKEGTVRGWDHKEWGADVRVDRPLAQARPDDYDALLLPGGVMNPDKLRMDGTAIDFIRAFVDAGKPIAAICHGPWTLIEAGAVKGRRMTSYASIRTDLRNAGADWVDEEVVVDRNLVTSRHPGDIPAFNERMVEVFAQAARQTAGARTGGGRA